MRRRGMLDTVHGRYTVVKGISLLQARRDRETLVQHRQAYYASRMQTQTLVDLAEVRAAAKDGRARRARIEAGLTQAEVGAACGVSHAAISRWESGQRVPRGPAAKRYARLLGALLERLDQ